MKKQYNITVLLAQYNPDYTKLIGTINSILIQKGVNYEIIICDDGSAQDYFKQTEEYFHKRNFADYKFVKRKKNGGTVWNLENGIKVSTGRYVKLISPGDYLYNENTLSDLFSFMKEKNAEIAYGNVVRFVNEESKIVIDTDRMPRNVKVYHKKKYPYQRILKNMLLYWDWIIGASLIYKRSTFESLLGEIHGRVKYVEDLITFIAISDKIKIFHLDKFVIWYEWGTGVSTSGNNFWAEQIARDKDAVYALLYKKHPDNKVIKRAYLNNQNRFLKSKIKRYVLTVWLCPDKVWYLIISRLAVYCKKKKEEVRTDLIKYYLKEDVKNIKIRR